MSITAKYATTCSACHGTIAPGQKIEWTKGSPVRHTSCGSAPVAASKPATPGHCKCGKAIDAKYSQCYGCANPSAAGKVWDADRFNGYGAPKGRFVRACKTGGNCSSFGSGRSCGAPDCDGY